MLTFILDHLPCGVFAGSPAVLVTFSINLAIVSFVLVKIPGNYFSKDHFPRFLVGPSPGNSIPRGRWEKSSWRFAGHGGYCFVGSRRSGSGPLDDLTRDNAARFSGKT